MNERSRDVDDLTSRRRIPDLMARDPSAVAEARQGAWASVLVDPVAQIQELDDLRGRGLVSSEEFDVLKARIVSTSEVISWTSSVEPSPPPRRGS
jgi:hypothetical protein